MFRRRAWSDRGAAVPVSHLAMGKIPATAPRAAGIGSNIAAFVLAALGMVVGPPPQKLETPRNDHWNKNCTAY
jgi:hypothetical protein